MTWRENQVSLFIVVLFLLSGCGPFLSGPTSTATHTPTVPTSTPIPSATDTPTLTPTITLTPAVTPTAEVNREPSGCVVATPPHELKLESWFTQYCDANGIAVLGSANVSEGAMEQAHDVAMNMFGDIEEERDRYVGYGLRVIIYDRSAEEKLTEIPGINVNGDWGGYDRDTKSVVTWDSDLLCQAQNLVHEFGHAAYWISLSEPERDEIGEIFNDPERRGALFYQAQLDRKTIELKWDQSEYWAEGVVAYFDAYWYKDSDAIYHRYTRQMLEDTDHDLFEIIKMLLGELNIWRPKFVGPC